MKICTMIVILLFVAIIDFRTKKIPNILIIISLFIRMILFIPEYFIGFDYFNQCIAASIIGLLVPLIVLLILSAITKDGLGMGDIKILSVLGFVMGLESVLYTLFYGMLIFAFYIVIVNKTKKAVKMLKIRLGPFIFIGFLCSSLHKML